MLSSWIRRIHTQSHSLDWAGTHSPTYCDASHQRGALHGTRAHTENDDEFSLGSATHVTAAVVCAITPTESRSTKDRRHMANLPSDITQNGGGREAGTYY